MTGGGVNQNTMREIINYASAKLYLSYGHVSRFKEDNSLTLESRDRYGNRLHIIFKTYRQPEK
jgi:hypothetical protein